MFGFSNKGLALLIPGLILTGYAVIKLYIVGYYPSETVPTIIIFAVGIALIWAARKFCWMNAAQRRDAQSS